jgi:hypothetical protein
MKKLIIICVFILFKCSIAKDVQQPDELWGAWNYTKNRSEEMYNTKTVLGFYKCSANHILLVPKIKNYPPTVDTGMDLQYEIDVINGKYPNYELKIRYLIRDLQNGEQVDKYIYGYILLHFINKDEFWIEKKFSPDLENINAKYAKWIKFEKGFMFHRAEKINDDSKMEFPEP